MSPEQILKVVNQYARQLPVAPIRVQDTRVCYHPRQTKLEHAAWMCREVANILSRGSIEKAHRWLGFIQGVMWCEEMRVLEDLKADNRSEDFQRLPTPTLDTRVEGLEDAVDALRLQMEGLAGKHADLIAKHAIDGDHCEPDVVRAIVERQAAAIKELVRERDELKEDLKHRTEQMREAADLAGQRLLASGALRQAVRSARERSASFLKNLGEKAERLHKQYEGDDVTWGTVVEHVEAAIEHVLAPVPEDTDGI